MFSSVQSLSCAWLFATHELQHARPPCPSPIPRAYSNSCPLSQWCHSTISFSVIPFCSHLQSFPASGSFPMSQLFSSGGHSIGVSASTSVLPMNTQDWSPLGWTGWISLQSKGLSRVFSNTIVQKNTGVGSLSLLQGIFPTQGLNPGLPHGRWILYQLSHKGSPSSVHSMIFIKFTVMQWSSSQWSSGTFKKIWVLGNVCAWGEDSKFPLKEVGKEEQQRKW